MKKIVITLFLLLFTFSSAYAQNGIWERVEHGFADNNGVKIHYAKLGAGPLAIMIHGLKDQYLPAAGLNDTWEWLESDLTIVTIPNAGHFVQQDAADLVTRSMAMWLNR